MEKGGRVKADSRDLVANGAANLESMGKMKGKARGIG